MTDLVTFGESALRLVPRGVERLETADALAVEVTGAESNAAVAARRLGAEVTWASRLPESALGRRVARELRGHDLDVAASWVDGGRQGLTFHERGDHPRTDARTPDREGSVVADATGEDLPLDALDDADGVYATGATAGVSREGAAAVARLLKAATERDATAAFGLSYRPDRWDSPEAARETLTELFPAVDVLVASESDVATVLDRDGQPAEVAHALAAEWDFDAVALRREHTGVAWRDATVHEFPVVECETVDATGAADAFAGAFVAELLADAPVDAALRRALAADALTRTEPTATPSFTRQEAERVAADVAEDA